MAASRPLISPSPGSSGSSFGGPIGAGIGAIGNSLFGYDPKFSNPADSVMPYLNKIPDELRQFLMPYINHGNNSYGDMNQKYREMMNPTDFYAKIGQGYKQSPGYQFALKQAMSAGDNAAAAGGMLGSPQHQYMNADVAEGLASRDYENYFNHAMNIFGGGMGGEQHLYDQGFGASKDLAEALSQLFMKQGEYAGRGAEADNQNEQNKARASSDMWGGIGGLVGSFFK